LSCNGIFDKLMALAICLDQLIKDGVVIDQAELARLGRVTRARLTQIMNLLNLAPEIQQHVLQCRDDNRGRPCVTERQLRPIAAVVDWRVQRRLWKRWPSPGGATDQRIINQR
jgi:hypothetical protein